MNKTYFKDSTPNASLALVLPLHAGDKTDYGFTYAKGTMGNKTVPIQVFDIGARFNGECRGNHNCNFNYDPATGRITTYFGLCLIAIPTSAPPAPPPAPSPAPSFPNCTTPICFSWTQQDHMVLQQAPAKSAVYGTIQTTMQTGAAVEVTVSAAGGASYTVPATVTTEGGETKWKALLKPAPAGGDYTMTAKCTAGCKGTAQISDVTFGTLATLHVTFGMLAPRLHDSQCTPAQIITRLPSLWRLPQQ